MTSAASPYAGTSKVASLSTGGLITVLDGQSFCLSTSTGDIEPGEAQGLFVLDTRVLSLWALRLNGSQLEPLAAGNDDPFSAVFLSRGDPVEGHADSDLVVFRRRHVGNGMRERISVENHGLEPRNALLELTCDVDFANLFEVKDNRVRRRGHHRYETSSSAMSFVHFGSGNRHGSPKAEENPTFNGAEPDNPGQPEPADPGSGTHGLVGERRVTKEVTISFSVDVEVAGHQAIWNQVIQPGESLEICIEVTVRLAGNDIKPVFTCSGDDSRALPNQRLVRWKAQLPVVGTDDARLEGCLERSREDIGSLRIFDPEHPDVPILAAGSPWFMTVFGRDSLITAWMSLPADRGLVRGVLETLARFQGQRVDPGTEEEPGKILHEMRFGEASGISLGGGETYYGTIDATPLFVMLAGELQQWDPLDDTVARLLPNIDAALEWIQNFGDRDGDGYVEYQRSTENSLINQGWKDSWDAIRFADGRLAETPIALCEVQGYVYAAYRARARIAHQFGDGATEQRFTKLAEDLRERFNRDFWLEDRGFYALALDGNKEPVDSLTSNVGHCLWTGIIDPERSRQVAERLLSSDFFSGWGVRTLAKSMAAYNPISYHNGSIWPHDNAICAAGLKKYGHDQHAGRIIRAQINTAASHGYRLPELFAGFDRERLPIAASYPTSCSPQAWAAASPLLWLRTILGFDANIPEGEAWLSPGLPPGITRLSLKEIDIGGRLVNVRVTTEGAEVEGVGDVDIHRFVRPLP